MATYVFKGTSVLIAGECIDREDAATFVRNMHGIAATEDNLVVLENTHRTDIVSAMFNFARDRAKASKPRG